MMYLKSQDSIFINVVVLFYGIFYCFKIGYFCLGFCVNWGRKVVKLEGIICDLIGNGIVEMNEWN